MPSEPKSKIAREPAYDGDNKPKGSDLEKAKRKKIKTKKMEKFFGLGGTSTSGQNPTSSTSQGTKGATGGTGDIKTNIGNLLGG